MSKKQTRRNARAERNRQLARRKAATGNDGSRRESASAGPATALSLLLVSALALGLTGHLAAELPTSLRFAERYLSARPCPANVLHGCLATGSYLLADSHVDNGHNPDNWVRLYTGGGGDSGAPAIDAARRTVHLRGRAPALAGIRFNDHVQVVSWEGRPLSVSVAGEVEHADSQPSDPAFEELTWIPLLLPPGLLAGLAGVRLLSGRTGVRRLRGHRTAGRRGGAGDGAVGLAIAVPAAALLCAGFGQQFDSLDLAVGGDLAVSLLGALLWASLKRDWPAGLMRRGTR